MYYLQTNENASELVHFCRICGNYEAIDSTKNSVNSDAAPHSRKTCVMTTFVNSEHNNDNALSYDAVVTPFTKYDPTLPRVNYILCPNDQCISNQVAESAFKNREVIYMRYDHTSMKYLYLCTHCNSKWRAT